MWDFSQISYIIMKLMSYSLMTLEAAISTCGTGFRVRFKLRAGLRIGSQPRS